MTKVLIATKPDDMHAIYAKLALNKNGLAADLWYTADFPTKSAYSFEIARNKFLWQTDEGICPIHDNDYHTIWYRRPAKPVLPDYIHPDDVSNAKKENLMFFQNMWQAIYPNAIWINPVSSAARSNSKILQLKIADKAHLNIPETLISNNPLAIKDFIKKNNAIYKPLYPVAWVDKNEMRLTYTKSISVENLPSDKLLQCTPGIFQQKIEKQYELRITYFGNKYIAVKIHSQIHDQAKMDWRSAPVEELLLEQVVLPDKIDLACKETMKNLGIVFGCFDFIVTPENEYYFLEVNEQGQFLWIEGVNPDIKMLQAFTEFVSNKTVTISMSDLREEAERFMSFAMKNHINPPQF